MNTNIQISSVWDGLSSFNQDVYIHSSSTFDIYIKTAKLVDITYNTSKESIKPIVDNKNIDSTNNHIK